MSRLSIYESGWLNLVFEGKNKDYGAYQLRKESDKTTALAFLFGLLMVGLAIGIPKIINHSSAESQIVLPDTDMVVRVSNLNQPKLPKPLTQTLPVQKKTTEVKKETQLVHPEIVKPIDANNNIATNTNNKTTVDTPQGTGTEVTTTTVASGGSTGETAMLPDTSVHIGATLDKLPQLPGGIEKLYDHVKRNFNNPETDEIKTLRVYVSFIIEKDGTMTDIQVKRDPGYGMAKEAIRVLKSFKIKWEPGIEGGKPVRTAYNLPITVQIQ